MKTNFLITVSLFYLSSIFAASTIPQPVVEQGERWTSRDVKNAEHVLKLMREKLIRDTGNNPLMRRDAHPKHHGCVKANLAVDNSQLSKEHRVGLFAKNSTYPALIRFSNGSPNHTQADIEPDVRGMAVKVMGVPYSNYLTETNFESTSGVHDILTMNSPIFFIKNTRMYVDFLKAFSKGGMRVAWFSLMNPKVAYILYKIFSEKVYNPLDPDYHSATPYKLGNTSMKMKFTSCKTNKDLMPRNPENNFLSKNLQQYLASNASCFEFYIQPNQDPRNNNIENPMRLWNPQKSPFIKVGTLTIPSQKDILSDHRQEFCENVSFNPWRAPENNRPMGAANRTRLEVYSQQAKFRQNYNSVADPYPTNHKDIP